MLAEPNSELYLGAVYDAMYALGHHASEFYIDLKPKAGYSKFLCGPVFTTLGRKLEKGENFQELDLLKYDLYDRKNFINNPVVMLQANDNLCAHFGDINTLIYKKMGVAGFITDGNIRDSEIIDEYKFPVFCENITPIDSANHWILTDFNTSIVIKGVCIEPLDWVYASVEGVIRVKKSDKLKFQEKLSSILEKEIALRNFILNECKIEVLSEELKNHSLKNGRW